MAETIASQTNSNLIDRQQMLEQYEQRFFQVRSFIEQKDFQIEQLTEETHQLQTQNVQLQEQIHHLKQVFRESDDENFKQMQLISEKLKEKDEEWLVKFHHVKDEQARALSEKDRMLEAL